MRKLLVFLTVPMFLGAGLHLASPADPPMAPRAPAPRVDATTAVPGPERVVTIATPTYVAPAATRPEPADLVEAELKSLLQALDECARLRPGSFPKAAIEAVAALLRDHPDAVDRLLSELPALSRGVRTYLVHAITMTHDRRIIVRLTAALAATDPGRQRIDRALADPVSIVAALETMEKSGDRKDLVNRLTAKHLADRGVVEKLRDLSESDEDAGVRAVAVFRLTKTGDRSSRSRAIGILEDRTRDLAERKMAAFALEGRAEAEVIDAFVEILRRGEDPTVLLVFAARGLLPAIGRSEAIGALFDLLLNPDHGMEARRSSAWTIALGAKRLRGDARSNLEERAYGALVDLENQSDADEIYAYTRSQFTDSLGPAFRNLVRPAAGVQSSVSGMTEHDLK